MECDRICIYRIYRSFGIVIEQRARTINFRSTNLLTHAHAHTYTRISIRSPIRRKYLYFDLKKNKNFDISNIFYLRDNTFF